MRVDLITSREALLRLRGNWDAVYQADPEAQLYMSSMWISGWFEKLRSQWIVLAAKNDAASEDYLGFFPLQLHSVPNRDGTFRNELRTGGGYFAGYTGFLCDPRFEPEVMQAFGKATRALNWSRLHLDNILATPERLDCFLKEFAAPEFVTEKVQRPDDGDGIDHDIYVYVNLPADWDAFLYERLSASTRRNARAALRQVENGGEYRVAHPTAETIEEDIEALLKFWEEQWAAKLAARYNPGLPYGMMSNFRRMLRCCFANNALLLPILWQGDKRIGIQASLIDWKNRSLISLLNGRDLGVRRPPPGFVLHLHCIRWGIENGFAVYDLQTGNFPYKYDFGGFERRIDCLRVTTHDRQNLRGRLEPLSLAAVFGRARALRQSGKPYEALQACRQILDSKPDHAEAAQLSRELEAELRPEQPATLSLAKQLYQSGRAAEAEQVYRSILRADPQNFEAAYLLGVMLLQQGRFELAERQIGFAIRLQPDFPASHYNRGLALMRLNRTEEALASFNSAIALKPDYELAIAQREDALKRAEAWN